MSGSRESTVLVPTKRQAISADSATNRHKVRIPSTAPDRGQAVAFGRESSPFVLRTVQVERMDIRTCRSAGSNKASTSSNSHFRIARQRTQESKLLPLRLATLNK